MARRISIADYTYQLPDARIAQYPLADRASSKLLVYRNGSITDKVFSELPDLLPDGSTLVFNTTKVVPARILFPVEGKGKPIEIFILEPADTHTTEEAMLQKGTATWKCLVGNHKLFTSAQIRRAFKVNDSDCYIEADKPVPSGDAFYVTLRWSETLTFSEMLDAAGQIPLPPYMKRDPDASDRKRYQTVYAREEGSVAAPTAGLHFTDAVVHALQQRGIHTEHVALHVGAGTFRPVKATTMEGHDMHAEEISVTRQTLSRLLLDPEHIVAVGTTSLRTLESLFWIGLKWRQNASDVIPEVFQWDAFDLHVPDDFFYADALKEIISRMEQLSMETLVTKTRLLIAPGYTIRSAKGLITNFHQPNSTLLLLVATFVGNDWTKIYAHALEHDYRFLSYGDSSLLWKE